MPGKNRLTSYLLKKSVKTNTMSGVTITRSLIPCKHGQKSHRRHLATLWSKCSKTNLNQINKNDKKPLAMSFYPQLRASFIIWIRSEPSGVWTVYAMNVYIQEHILAKLHLADTPQRGNMQYFRVWL